MRLALLTIFIPLPPLELGLQQAALTDSGAIRELQSFRKALANVRMSEVPVFSGDFASGGGKCLGMFRHFGGGIRRSPI
jgi:hypothetical protein